MLNFVIVLRTSESVFTIADYLLFSSVSVRLCMWKAESRLNRSYVQGAVVDEIHWKRFALPPH